MIQNPCSLVAQEIADRFNSDLENGLDKDAIRQNLQEYGPNQVPKDAPKSWWHILKNQVLDPIIYILTAAALLAFVFSDWLEGLAIIIVILVSVAIGFMMESQAVRSLQALRKMGQTMAYALRSGKFTRIRASELVPGDIISLQTGDVVTADARLIYQENLTVKESALTGESVAVSKTIKLLPAQTPISDQRNMLFKGTIVTTGRGRAIVTCTGANTQLGKIQLMGMGAKRKTTPLEKKLNQLSKWLIWLTLVFAVLIIITGYIRGKELLFMIETGVALAVAAIPEGLPIVATIALARGMLRLSKKQVIIKKLEAVQTLGATNIICTDKTGTLTEDRMKVHTILCSDASFTDVQQMNRDGFAYAMSYDTFEKIMLTSILCNNTNPFDNIVQEDSIETALLDFAIKLGFDIEYIRDENPEKLQLPFDAYHKLMATLHRNKHGFYVYAKGAFEKIVAISTTILENGKIKRLDQKAKEKWYLEVDQLAEKGLRTLAFAYKETEGVSETQDLVEELVFLGVIGFIDPARSDIKATIDTYKKAGIKVIMATGDHPKTAQKIAEDVGLLAKDAPVDQVVWGKDLKSVKTANKRTADQILNASVFARVTPKQKLDLISFHQKNGNIIGMIGDGINDVPALKKADVGIAMGIRGTEAAREAADVILKNDKFTAIELAIRQGRVVFQNIRQFVVYLLSCNTAEIFSVGIAALLNLPSPLLPLQILFLNLVTDVFPALALGLGEGEEDSMEQPPRNPAEPIMTKDYWYATLGYGMAISASVLGVVIYADFVLKLDWDVINNMAFYTLVLAQLFNVFNMPKESESFFNNEVTKNPYIWGAIVLSLSITAGAYLVPPVANVLSLQSISPKQAVLTVLFAFGSLVLAQVGKRLRTIF